VCSTALPRNFSACVKTFLDANARRKKSVHRDFSNAILDRKMWLKINIIKYIQNLEGRFSLYMFQVS
jgi:hypothetical protein